MIGPSKPLTQSLVLAAILAISLITVPAYSQTTENTTIINATTLPNGTTQLNGTSMPEQDMSTICAMPIFRNSDMCS
jgi:hypothetical protein